MHDDDPVRALSLRQPYAYAVLRLGKNIENRTRRLVKPGRRRRVLIHATYPPLAYWEDAARWMEARGLARPFRIADLGHMNMPRLPRRDELVHGVILGAMTLTGVILNPAPDAECRWHMEDRYGHEIADVEELGEPVPCLGELGLRRVPPEALERIPADVLARVRA